MGTWWARGQSRIGYRPLIQYLVNHGYAILAVNNRGSSGYGKTFYSLDDKNLRRKRFKRLCLGKNIGLEKQDCLDSEKIGIIGGSYGGFMTMAAMAFMPEEFKVGVNIYGVTNWVEHYVQFQLGSHQENNYIMKWEILTLKTPLDYIISISCE